METPKGFFTTLFDFSFSEFIVPKIIKVLFGIGIIGAAIFALGMIVSGFAGHWARGLLMIILSPVFFALGVIIVRVYMELILVLFRIADNTSKMVQDK